MSEKYPLLNNVCSYGTLNEFKKQRIESGQWVHWKDNIRLVLEGKYFEVKPLHVELLATLECNFRCPWCNCRSAREIWWKKKVERVMTWKTMKTVIAELANYQTGIQWTGGEPLLNPNIFQGMHYAHSLGLKQCLFTNGSLLTVEKARLFLETEPVFVRFSINAVTPNIHSSYHGYFKELHYVKNVIENLKAFSRLKTELDSNTKCAVSIVFDKTNFLDLGKICDMLYSINMEEGSNAIDYVLIRPTFQIYNSEVDSLPKGFTIPKSIARKIRKLGTLASIPTPCLVQDHQENNTHHFRDCYAYGWFNEILPNGDVQLCSDTYGNPNYCIGNLNYQSFGDIIAGKKRAKLISNLRDINCCNTVCQKNGRGFFLNNIFNQVEEFRSRGNINCVEKWIDDIRKAVPKPSHSFYF